MHPIPVDSLPLVDPAKVKESVTKILDDERSGCSDYSHKKNGWHVLGKTKIKINGQRRPIRALWAFRDLREAVLEDNDKVEIIDCFKIKLGEVTLRTLRGVLHDEVGEADGDVVYDHITKVEEELFSWSHRGPRIFQKLHISNCDIAIIEEYDVHFGPRASFSSTNNCNQCNPTPEEALDTKTVDSLPDAEKTTFFEAMSAHGYDGRLFDGYLKQGEGIGIFWKRDTFSPKEDEKRDVPEGECEVAPAPERADESIVPITEYRPSISNVGFAVKDATTGDFLPDRLRRHLALIRLIHRESGKELQVVGCHLTPTSRDTSDGHIRSQELRQALDIVSRHQADVPTIFAGDFNINMRLKAEEHILKRVEAYEAFDDKRIFRLPGPESDFILQDVYGDIDDRQELSTSFSRTRNETIDYIFYSPSTLEVTWRGELICLTESMPNEIEPSDHIALEAEFKFLS